MVSETLPEEVKAIVPTGRLRAAVNASNKVIAQTDPVTGEVVGVAAVLAKELARRLQVPVDIIPYPGPKHIVDAADTDAWDICFLAIDPVREKHIAFAAPYVVIEGTYMVPEISSLSEASADADGVRIVVGKGSAYDLHLTREIKHATLVRAEGGSTGAFNTFVAQKLDAMAGVRQALDTLAATNPGLRVMKGRFMEIQQAIGTKPACAGSLPYLRTFIREAKVSGLIATALTESGQSKDLVAP